MAVTAAAIGLSLDENTLETFKEQLQKNFKNGNFSKQTVDPDIVGELSFSEISFALTELMKRYEPYGQGNPDTKVHDKKCRDI